MSLVGQAFPEHFKRAVVVVYKGTLCPRSVDPFYIVLYYIKWVKTFWTDSTEY